MPLYATDTIRRGQSGQGQFPVAEEADLKVSYIVQASLADLQALPMWKRISKMFGFAILENKEYQLQSDLLTWVDVTVTIPPNVVTEDEIFDSNGYILSDRIKNIYVNDSFVVGSEAAMLALSSVTGNVIIRTDSGQVFFKLNNDDPSDLGDFADITANTGAVTSVNGQTGAVNITIGNLLAIGANLTAFNVAVASAPAVTSNTSAIATLQTALGITNSELDELVTYVLSHLGSQPLSSKAKNPTAAEINYSLVWDGNEFSLANPSYVFASDITVALSGGKTLGPYGNGQTIPAAGKTAEQVLNLIAKEYLLPAFGSFAITGQATTIEAGTTIAGASKTFTWTTINNLNITPNSLKIRNVNTSTDLITGLANDGAESIALGSVTLTLAGSTQTYRIIGTNTNSGTFQTDFVITAQYKFFYGSVSAAPLNSADVRALSNSRFATAGNVWILDSGTVNNKFAFAILATKSLVSVIDLDALSANITSEYLLIGAFNVSDAGGNPIPYKIYMKSQAINYSSNHRHQITIA